MGLWLLLVFVGLPIAEIAVFIVVGGWIGVLPTVLLVLFAGVAGIGVIRMQGFSTLVRLQQSLDQGGDPVGPVADGALKVIAGVLLLMPGFLTDVAALLLLTPAVRRWLMRRGAARVTVRATTYARRPHPADRSATRPPETIDANYEVVDEPSGRPGNSGWTRPQ